MIKMKTLLMTSVALGFLTVPTVAYSDSWFERALGANPVAELNSWLAGYGRDRDRGSDDDDDDDAYDDDDDKYDDDDDDRYDDDDDRSGGYDDDHDDDDDDDDGDDD